LEQNWYRFNPVRLIGISLGGFIGQGPSGQMSLFDLADDQKRQDKEEQIDQVMDKIRTKHGMGKIRRGTLIR
ncbi:MAG: DNA polymerase IV, partial [Dehalobacterium sp.]